MKIKYSFSLSRLLKHIEDNTFGIVSAYLGKLSLKENKERHKKLKSLVKSKGYGYKEIKGFWKGEETGKLEEEYALFIPKVSLKDIKDLGKEFKQEAIIHGEPEKDEITLLAPLTNTTLRIFKEIHTNPNESWDMYSKIKNKSFKFATVEWYISMPPEKNSFMNALAVEAWKDFSKCSDLSEGEDRQATIAHKVKEKLGSK